MNEELEATFSTLVMSIGSSAAISLGLTPHPETGKVEKDSSVARFNIDLLKVLEKKTEGNLSEEELNLLKNIISDLQLKFVQPD